MADAGGRRIDMDSAVADGKAAAAIVGKADTDAGVLQGTGDSHIRAAVIVNVFYGFQRFGKARRRVGNLPLGRTSPGRIALRYRISQGSMPAISASLFKFNSVAKIVWVTPNPRKAPAGGLLV